MICQPQALGDSSSPIALRVTRVPSALGVSTWDRNESTELWRNLLLGGKRSSLRVRRLIIECKHEGWLKLIAPIKYIGWQLSYFLWEGIRVCRRMEKSAGRATYPFELGCRPNCNLWSWACLNLNSVKSLITHKHSGVLGEIVLYSPLLLVRPRHNLPERLNFYQAKSTEEN